MCRNSASDMLGLVRWTGRSNISRLEFATSLSRRTMWSIKVISIPDISKCFISGCRSRSSKTSDGNDKISVDLFVRMTDTRDSCHFCIELVRNVMILVVESRLGDWDQAMLLRRIRSRGLVTSIEIADKSVELTFATRSSIKSKGPSTPRVFNVGNSAASTSFLSASEFGRNPKPRGEAREPLYVEVPLSWRINVSRYWRDPISCSNWSVIGIPTSINLRHSRFSHLKVSSRIWPGIWPGPRMRDDKLSAWSTAHLRNDRTEAKQGSATGIAVNSSVVRAGESKRWRKIKDKEGWTMHSRCKDGNSGLFESWSCPMRAKTFSRLESESRVSCPMHLV